MSADMSPPGIEPLTYEAVEKYANRCIRTFVRTVVGRHGFSLQDREDLESEIRVHLISRLHLYDPTRGVKTNFITHVVVNRLRQLIAMKKVATARMPAGPSLSDTLVDSEGSLLPRSEMFDFDEYLDRLGRSSRTTRENRDLALDMELASRRLPPDLAELYGRLKTQTIREICEETGAPKSSVQYRILRIRRVFEEEGLRDYFRAPPSFHPSDR